MSEEKRTNHLNQKQKFEVARFLQTIEEKCLGERPSWKEAAEWCTEKLGYQITEANVYSVVKDGGCTPWVPRNAHKGIGGAYAKMKASLERFTALEETSKAAIKDTVERIEVVEHTLESFEKLLGQFSTKLDDLAKECQRLRVAVVDLYTQTKLKPHVDAGVPLTFTKSTTVANGPR